MASAVARRSERRLDGVPRREMAARRTSRPAGVGDALRTGRRHAVRVDQTKAGVAEREVGDVQRLRVQARDMGSWCRVRLPDDMREPWRFLFEMFRGNHFAEFEGAEGTATLPVPTRLLTELVRTKLPPAIQADGFGIHVEPDDVIRVELRLTKPSFLPLLKIRLKVDQQPEFPSSPVLGLRLLSHGIAALAGPASRLFQIMPPGIRLDGDLLTINLAEQLQHYGVGDALQYITDVRLTTAPGRLILNLRAAIPPAESFGAGDAG